MQAVIRLLKTLGMAQIGIFLDWKKKAWQGWKNACSAVTSEGGRCSPKMSWRGVWAENTVQRESVWSGINLWVMGSYFIQEKQTALLPWGLNPDPGLIPRAVPLFVGQPWCQAGLVISSEIP